MKLNRILYVRIGYYHFINPSQLPPTNSLFKFWDAFLKPKEDFRFHKGMLQIMKFLKFTINSPADTILWTVNRDFLINIFFFHAVRRRVDLWKSLQARAFVLKYEINTFPHILPWVEDRNFDLLK